MTRRNVPAITTSQQVTRSVFGRKKVATSYRVPVAKPRQQPRKVGGWLPLPQAQPAPAAVVSSAPAKRSTMTFDDYVGQTRLKRTLQVYTASAKARGDVLPHVLLASGMPGVGKTTMGRILANVLDVDIVELVPPFSTDTLVDTITQRKDGDIVFIDEIHKMSDGNPRGAEILLKILEEGTAQTRDGRVIDLPRVTIVGATTDAALLPEPVLDRFKIRPTFEPYTHDNLVDIADSFALRHGVNTYEIAEVVDVIADACRSTPRIVEEFVLGFRDLSLALGRPVTGEELLDFLDVQRDGLTALHVRYLTTMLTLYAREGEDGVEYIAGERAIVQSLRENKVAVARTERLLIERGYIDLTAKGRRLTPAGVARATELR